MAASYGLILLLMLCCCSNLVFSEDYEDLEGEISWHSKILKNGQKEIMMKNENPNGGNGKALSYPGCGFRKPKISRNRRQTEISYNNGSRRGVHHRKIVGGLEVEKHSWPWMVAIFNTGRDDWNIRQPLSCGASLISRKYALTAAHCFVRNPGKIIDTDPSKRSVVVGVHSLSHGLKYPVSRIIMHPYYNPHYHNYDIALIEFKTPVVLSKTVYPVCLPSTGLTDKIEESRSEVIATGWGRIAQDSYISHVLKEIGIFSVPLNECKAFFRDVVKEQFCAGGTKRDKGKDTCMGDSGGPLVYEMEDNSYVQVGIVSYGVRCAEPGWPAVYTRVSEYTKWIYDNSDLGK